MIENKNFQAAVKKRLDKLIQSATFAMSLGAKELFHTNFLAFLLESEQDSIDKVTKALKQKLFGPAFDGAVWAFRERKNMDLIVVPKNPCSTAEFSAVIIEAKMKSVPSIEQLKVYNQKISGNANKKYFDIGELDSGEVNSGGCDYVRLSGGNTIQYRVTNPGADSPQWVDGAPKKIRRVLLAPSNPYKTNELPVDESQWEYWSWTEIQSVLFDAVGQGHGSDDTLLSLVRNYAEDLKNISALLDATSKYVDGVFCSKGSRVDFEIFDRSILEPFKKARIHDLISKYAYWCLSQKIQEQMHDAVFELDFQVHFSRGTPIIEIAKKLKDSIAEREIGVQIQSSQYRHFILSRKPDIALREFSEGRIEWFRIVDNEMSDMNFNKFDDKKFLYRKKDMKHFTFDDLCNELNASFRNCPDH